MKAIPFALLFLLTLLQQNVFKLADQLGQFGFLPSALAYQIAISLAAAALWGWIAIALWPRDQELQEAVNADNAS